MTQVINRRNTDFMLYEVLGVDKMLEHEQFGDFDREAVTAFIDTAQTIADELYVPIASELDANEPEFDGEKVHIMPEVKQALSAYCQAGFLATGFPQEVGGLNMPLTVQNVISGIFNAANGPLAGYTFLTVGAANMLYAHGSQELVDKYLPSMMDGRFFGTMCLSEPHAGSSLADIRTKAEPLGDGSYKITGTKMWISGGEHELSENIIHMVLAKTPDGPPGVRGISLFLVPKYRVNDDGSLGEKNNIALAGLNHKMGQRGTANCLLNFGETGDSIGYLVGEEFQGLANMFMMMNEARIAVGLGAVMCGQNGLHYSLEYAKERPQGRKPGDKDPQAPMVNIIEHADIKRMLMAQKAYVEGGVALILACSKLVDEAAVNPELKEDNELLLEILTPIAKSWPSEFCLEANKLAIQVLGGYGYTRDYPVERYYRDNRLNHIHEGTHAIHGIDILGRKVRMQNGAAFALLKEKIRSTIKAAAEINELADYGRSLNDSLEAVDQATQRVLAEADIELGLANATPYLDAMGHLVVGWLWLQQGLAAQKGLETAETQDECDFYDGKLRALRYFMRYDLPQIAVKMDLVASLDDTCLRAPVGSFASA
ncbi:MAG: acyl-CoA dehydrogenase [Parvibaculales bacterium]